MPKMRAIQVPSAKGPFQLVEIDIPEPVAGSVRIKVQACGICHSDEYAKEGSRPGIQYPRIPGHEIAGIIDAVGAGIAGWEVGQRVGVGWHGGHCGDCTSCRRGDFVTCSKARQITGLTRDGGYADYMIASAGALALIPSELSAVDAGPLLCAGVTTFNALRNSGARPGDLVAILGVGDQISWPRSAVSQCIECCDARAKQRPCVYRGKFAGNQRKRSRGGDHVVRVTSVAGQTRDLSRLAARHEITAAAGVAISAMSAVPADPNSLPHFPPGNARAHGVDDSRDLMSGDARVLNPRP